MREHLYFEDFGSILLADKLAENEGLHPTQEQIEREHNILQFLTPPDLNSAFVSPLTGPSPRTVLIDNTVLRVSAYFAG